MISGKYFEVHFRYPRIEGFSVLCLLNPSCCLSIFVLPSLICFCLPACKCLPTVKDSLSPPFNQSAGLFALHTLILLCPVKRFQFFSSLHFLLWSLCSPLVPFLHFPLYSGVSCAGNLSPLRHFLRSSFLAFSLAFNLTIFFFF